eukprot:TRINITY_DN1264_c2_g2_i1.p1 TRINITY_DN1264_c2_g2~~TRINITY_DN1264_c2_g2_i1.p1  ORF type:complete len:670 (-),score=99.37 TRINITY_DN1264_c2_g2_i1:170-2179(-)
MLLALSLFFSGTLTGFLINFSFLPEFGVIHSLFSSIPIGIVITSWIAYIISCYFEAISMEAIYITIFILMIISITIIIRRFREYFARSILYISEISDSNSVIPILIVTSSAIVYLLNHHILNETGNFFHCGGALWGDIALHLDIMNSFVHGRNYHLSFSYPPENPIFAGGKLAFGFLPDFHSAVLKIAGLTDRQAMILPHIFVMISFISLLYLFQLKFLKGNKKAAILSVVLYIFAGGIGFLYWIFEHHMSTMSLNGFDFIERVNDNVDENLYWLATIPHVLLPQRQSMYSFPIILIITTCLYQSIQPKTKFLFRIRLQLFAGIITGFLPLIQSQGYLSVFLLVVGLIISRIKHMMDPEEIISLATFMIPSLLLGVPQYSIFYSKIASNDSAMFYQFYPLIADDKYIISIFGSFNPVAYILGFILFWFRSLGFFIPLSIIGFIYCAKSNYQRQLSIAAWFIFIIANLYRFQFWRYDNVKLFHVWFFIVVGNVSLLLVSFFKKPKKQLFPKILAILIIISLTFSGVLALRREFTLYYPFYGNNETDFGAWVNLNTTPDSTFLSSTNHINVISTIAGRSLFLGYDQWVTNQGFYNEFSHRLNVQNAILRGGSEAFDLLKSYQIDFVVIDPYLLQLNSDKVNKPWFDEAFPSIYSENGYTCYETWRSYWYDQ